MGLYCCVRLAISEWRFPLWARIAVAHDDYSTHKCIMQLRGSTEHAGSGM